MTGAIPTEPGVYFDSIGRVWELDDEGFWNALQGDSAEFKPETLVLAVPKPENLLDPPLSLPPVTAPDGTQSWPGDPRWVVTVQNVYGTMTQLIPEAYSLMDALDKAKAIPLVKWFQGKLE